MKNRLTKKGRALIILAALMLASVLFFPIWQIQLSAPQYPEGLVLRIYPNKLAGNVDIINGLNHYIGMKTLHSSDFFEFTVLPYIILIFSIALLLTAIIGKRTLLNILFTLFVCFGVVAMTDFWRWEYNYGHNLNPDAAIIVPGMAYQPPLIGFKQLLNFGAYSIPDIGGWLFLSVGIGLLIVVTMEWNSGRQKNRSIKLVAKAASIISLFLVNSCTNKPEPIIPGKDNCSFCKMTVSDPRFGAEIITQKGKIFKFDDIHCLLSYLKEDKIVGNNAVRDIYLTDFADGHSLLNADKAALLQSDALNAPMGGHIAAFAESDSLLHVEQIYNGSVLNWNQVYKP